jgi:hypothetical protein
MNDLFGSQYDSGSPVKLVMSPYVADMFDDFLAILCRQAAQKEIFFYASKSESLNPWLHSLYAHWLRSFGSIL